MLPHLDGEIAADTEVVEELLLWLRPASDDPDALRLDPNGVFDAGADAIGTLRLAMLTAPPLASYAPRGRWERVPVQVLDVPARTVDDYGAAAAALAMYRAPGADNAGLADDMDDYAASYGTTAEAIVDVAGRFHALSGLEWSEDHDTVRRPLERARATGRGVVLTPAEDAAYLRLCDRFVSLWHANDPLARWMYGVDGVTVHRARPDRTATPAPWLRDRKGFVR